MRLSTLVRLVLPQHGRCSLETDRVVVDARMTYGGHAGGETRGELGILAAKRNRVVQRPSSSVAISLKKIARNSPALTGTPQQENWTDFGSR